MGGGGPGRGYKGAKNPKNITPYADRLKKARANRKRQEAEREKQIDKEVKRERRKNNPK